MAWITTKTEPNLPTPVENKRKGMAMEAAVQELIEEAEGTETSLNDVLERAEDYLKNVYNVKKMFRIQHSSGYVTYRRNVSETDFDFKLSVDFNQLPDDKVDIKTVDKREKIFLGYKKCSNCRFIFPRKFCKSCGGAVFDDRWTVLKKIKKFNNQEEQFSFSAEQKDLTRVDDSKADNFLKKIYQIKNSKWNTKNKFGYNDFCTCQNPNTTEHYFERDNYRKCRKCGKGNYRQMKTEFSGSKWKLAKENIDLEKALNFLIENGYLSQSSYQDKIKGKRLDNWRFDGNQVEVFESKNMEKTNLTTAHVRQVFQYIKALRISGLESAKDGRIIYNGDYPESLEKALDYFSEEFGYSIDCISIKEWCKEKGVYIDEIRIGKNIDGKQYSQNGDYLIDVSLSDSFVENPVIRIVETNTT